MGTQPLPPPVANIILEAEAQCSGTSVAPLSVEVTAPETSDEMVSGISSLWGGLSSLLAPDFGKSLLRRAAFFADSSKSPTLYTEANEAVPMSNSVTVSGAAHFGDVYVGNSATRTFTIRNPNSCPVNFYVAGAPYGFSLSTSSGNIPANGSTSVTITFRPPSDRSYSGSVSVTPGGGSVSMSGRGIERN